METKEGLKLLKKLVHLTKMGALRWQKAEGRGGDAFEATAEGMTFDVQFIYFPRNDGVGSDRTMARVSLPGFAFDYCIGTEGFDIACLLLSLQNKEWTD